MCYVIITDAHNPVIDTQNAGLIIGYLIDRIEKHPCDNFPGLESVNSDGIAPTQQINELLSRVETKTITNRDAAAGWPALSTTSLNGTVTLALAMDRDARAAFHAATAYNVALKERIMSGNAKPARPNGSSYTGPAL